MLNNIMMVLIVRAETAKKKGSFGSLKREFKEFFSLKPPFSMELKAIDEEKIDILPIEMKDEKAFEVSIDMPSELKKLESEHQARIKMLSENAQNLRENQEKLKKAIEVLKELNLDVPEEFTSRLNNYSVEVENLEAELDQEKKLLSYFQTKILPLIQKS